MEEKEVVRQIYSQFREDCGRNTLEIMGFIDFLGEKGVLHHLVGMDSLSILEQSLIDDSLTTNKNKGY